MTHLWMRAETRGNEERAGLTPEGAAALLSAGFRVTVEASDQRVFPDAAYAAAGCAMAPAATWPGAPDEALVLGLKELPEGDDRPLVHRHIMFGHAFKGQPAGQRLLSRFAAGGGALYDIEYLVDDAGRRIAAFGHWAGFAGAAVALRAWAAQTLGDIAEPLAAYDSADALIDDVTADLNATLAPRPGVIVVGALGRVGGGARALCAEVGVPVTAWDMAETANGGPFPEILGLDIFLNCVLAAPGCPVLVPVAAKTAPRRLRVIGDIACDPASAFNPVKVCDRVTDWDEPAMRVHDDPPLDVVAIDNLPSLLPLESSRDFAARLLPALLALDRIDAGPWARARASFDRAMAADGR